ncbi:TetR/AcrR family transcriptional regulator [Chthonobacter rhizosphaerae]|uniref:TetR/AcrR family transcriptional regulator n=1 Tax=Chthonobacter rhizosphaerae TaxID=2735553 RepID=UPI0015EFAA3B
MTTGAAIKDVATERAATESATAAASGSAGVAKKRGRPSSRERIVAAAVELVGEVGAGHLSLEAVAERAGISKGGLLYNFPTKTDLLKALVASHIIDLDIRRSEAEAALGEAPNRAACAFVAAAAADAVCRARPPSGFLAAIAENPGLLDPLRARNQALADRFRAAGDPCLSLIAFLAIEGLKTADLFETNPLTDEERAAVLKRLEEMLATGV